MSLAPIEAIGAVGAGDVLAGGPPGMHQPAPTGPGFAEMMTAGLERVDQKVLDAQALAAAFALDDSVPVHRVTYALEEARLSVELMIQVRNRLLEGYQELMRMGL